MTTLEEKRKYMNLIIIISVSEYSHYASKMHHRVRLVKEKPADFYTRQPRRFNAVNFQSEFYGHT